MLRAHTILQEGMPMAEFLFKNLAVKLFPTSPQGPAPCPGCSAVVSCAMPSVICHTACSLQVSCLACSTHVSGCCAHSAAVSVCQAGCSFTVSVCGTCSNHISCYAVSVCGTCSNHISCYAPSVCQGCSVVVSICQTGSVCPGGSGCPGGSACGGSIIGPERGV